MEENLNKEGPDKTTASQQRQQITYKQYRTSGSQDPPKYKTGRENLTHLEQGHTTRTKYPGTHKRRKNLTITPAV